MDDLHVSLIWRYWRQRLSQCRAKIYSNSEQAKHMLMQMGEIVGDLLADQVIHGGADGVQLFDTWAGLLSPEIYREFACLPLQEPLKYSATRSARMFQSYTMPKALATFIQRLEN